jgi:hypothetical protein
MNSIEKLNKKELLKIIGKMKKTELIKIINDKVGGGNSNIIKETNQAIRRNLPIDPKKFKNKINIKNENKTLSDNKEYNKIYIFNNNKLK